MENKTTIKNCPRCNQSFVCNQLDVQNCQCAGIIVSQPTKDYLSRTNYDCLCGPCLIKVNEMLDIISSCEFPEDYKSLEEDLHFYHEKGNIVFTEFYLIQRGYCCQNACRHCAYGFTKELG